MAKFNWETLNERLTWEEIRDKYPDCWVILKDCIMENLTFVKEATVVGVCSSDERFSIEEDIIRCRLNYKMESTSRQGGVLSCF